MFHCPPGSEKDPNSTTAKNDPTDGDKGTSESPRPPIKTNKSQGWSWPRLVPVAEQKDNTGAMPGSNQRSVNSSAANSIRDVQPKKSEMPGLLEESEPEIDIVVDPPATSRESNASSVRTMTQSKQPVGESGDIGEAATQSLRRSSTLESNGLRNRHDDQSSDQPESLEVHGDSNHLASLPDTGSAWARDSESQGIDKDEIPVIDNNKAGELDTASSKPESLIGRHRSESNAPKAQPSHRVSITFEDTKPLPPPRIAVQQASEAGEASNSFTNGNSRTPGERRMSMQQARESVSKEIAADVAHISPRPTIVQEAAPPKTLRPKKSSIVLRKTRNAVVRETVLKAVLGRELAAPTKQALRKRACGESVTMKDTSAFKAG